MGTSIFQQAETEIAECKVAVLDDEPYVLMAIKKILAAAGFRDVHTSSNPVEVLEWFRRPEDAPDVLLLDLEMPVMPGIDVLRRIRGLTATPQVIVVTSSTDRETRIDALQCGAADFLTKPTDSVELVLRIRSFLKNKILERKLERHNDTLRERILKRTAELRQSRIEVIQRLIAACEYRDTDTGEHVRRMSLVSAVLVRKLGLGERSAELIQHAASLHDIGKVAIPDSILLKPGELTQEEWVVMKTHTILGAEILKNGTTELIQTAHDIALRHHERWDGSGYPGGLRSEDIPLSARICAVADSLDAILSKRPYKLAAPFDKAIVDIHAGARRQFDPNIVEIFDGSLPEIMEIYGLPEKTKTPA